MKKNEIEKENINKDFHEIFLVDSGECSFIIKALNAGYAGAKLIIVIRGKNHSEIKKKELEKNNNFNMINDGLNKNESKNGNYKYKKNKYSNKNNKFIKFKSKRKNNKRSKKKNDSNLQNSILNHENQIKQNNYSNNLKNNKQNIRDFKKKNYSTKKNSENNSFNTSFNLRKMVDIPVLSVSYIIGERLKNFLNRKNNIILKFQMNIPKEDISKVHFYIKKDDTDFYKFLIDIKKSILQFENKILIKFFFFENLKEKNYVDTILLEKQINCVGFENVFNIIFYFEKNCKNFTSKCFNENMELLERSVYLSYKKCLKDTNSQKKITHKKIKNNKSYILINNIIYKGRKNDQNLFEAICQSFVKSPNNCIFLNNKYTPFKNYSQIKKKKIEIRFAFLILNGIALIFLLSIAGFVLILIYGKVYERILNENVESIVQNTIQNYNMSNLESNE